MENKDNPQQDQLKPVPQHIAIIMDGNGRWAKSHGMERSAGHLEGVNTVHTITQAAGELGVKYLTLYAFSTENWNRPQAEVDSLLNLITYALEKETPGLIENNVKLLIIGDVDRMPAEARARLDRSMEATANGTGLRLIVAFSYSSRWEITRACAKIAEEAAKGELDPATITDETVREHLTTAPYPDPDLLIRTGGDFRVSNFLLWQIAYSEIFVSPTFWPDFTREEFEAIIDNFRGRERRFGLTSEQINHTL
ncbi:MAG: isoprenyl transferase [Bacteroidales bacterium]|nr:isoprenyl transferase [Bacteroidales bacterium]